MNVTESDYFTDQFSPSYENCTPLNNTRYTYYINNIILRIII